MICSECSAEMPEISAYCPVCGYPVNAASDLFQAKDVTDSLLAAVAYVARMNADAPLQHAATAAVRRLKFGNWGKPFTIAGRVGFSILSSTTGQ